jgi:hypothetical protein
MRRSEMRRSGISHRGVLALPLRRLTLHPKSFPLAPEDFEILVADRLDLLVEPFDGPA